MRKTSNGSSRTSEISPERIAKQIAKILSPAIGKSCWHVSVGGCTLPTFSLALGAKLDRETPLRNPAQPAVFRRFRPEIAFFVWCVWRLEGDDVVTSSDGRSGEIEKGLKRLIGQPLTSIEVSPPAWDLTLEFANRLRLKVFCDHSGRRPSLDGNWDAKVGGDRVFAGAGSRLEIKHASAVRT